jgi:acrylyl-CoA reductase (NADPH)
VKTTVLPFLLRGLRGVNLLGIDSVTSPLGERQEAWRRLAEELPLDKLNVMTRHALMAELPELGRKILRGELRGRIVVDMNA